METIAVYREQKISTYGFDLQEDLNLWEVDLPGDSAALWTDILSELEVRAPRFEWIAARTYDKRSLSFRLLCAQDADRDLIQFVKDRGPGLTVWTIKPPIRVDVLSFQGPHFGDRCGIADYTLAALPDLGSSLQGMTCSTSGVTLVLSAGRGAAAMQALRRAFVIPAHTDQRRQSIGKDTG